MSEGKDFDIVEYIIKQESKIKSRGSEPAAIVFNYPGSSLLLSQIGSSVTQELISQGTIRGIAVYFDAYDYDSKPKAQVVQNFF